MVTPKVISGAAAGQHTCCDATDGKGNDKLCVAESFSGPAVPGWLLAHVACMVLGWVVLLPAGVSIAAFGKERFGDGQWFAHHRSLQTMGLLVATGGALLAITNVSSHADSSHTIIGLFVMVLAWLQPLNAFMRPHATAAGEVATAARKSWETLHKTAGRSALVLAVLNLALGSRAANAYLGQGNSLAQKGWFAFALGVLVLCQLFVKMARKGKEEESGTAKPAEGKPQDEEMNYLVVPGDKR